MFWQINLSGIEEDGTITKEDTFVDNLIEHSKKSVHLSIIFLRSGRKCFLAQKRFEILADIRYVLIITYTLKREPGDGGMCHILNPRKELRQNMVYSTEIWYSISYYGEHYGAVKKRRWNHSHRRNPISPANVLFCYFYMASYNII